MAVSPFFIWWLSLQFLVETSVNRYLGQGMGLPDKAYRIRPATAADKNAIASLVIKNHLRLSCDSPQEYVRQAMDISTDFEHIVNSAKFLKSFYLVATDRQGRVIASAGTIPTNVKRDERLTPDHSRIELTGVTVSQEFRKHGIARTLIQRCLEEAKRAASGAKVQVTLITLKERMEIACRLYRSIGFSLSKEERVHLDPLMTVQHYWLDL